MQTQQLLGFSRFPSQHLEESWSDVLGRKKVKLGQKSVLTRKIKRQLLGRVNRNPKFRLSGLLLTARRLVSNATAHRFLKNRDIRNRVAVQDVLTNARNDRRVNWCRRHSFLVGAFSLKEKSPTLTVSSFFCFFFSWQSHSEWSTFLTIFVHICSTNFLRSRRSWVRFSH